MNDEILQRAQVWCDAPYDSNTQEQVKHLIATDETALTDAFYKDLEFGTGGLRGKMGPGTNRINIYTISMATQGLANYLKASFNDDIQVAIAHDSRNNSRLFAETAADVLASNGITVHLFDALRPTPQLSFAIRHLNCNAGIVITASHNPKEYNGYKVYWEDGGQLVPPHDKNVIAEVRKIASYNDVKHGNAENRIKSVGAEMDEAYLEKVAELHLSKDAIAAQADLGIVYTNLHGTGGQLIPEALERAGFKNVHTVAAQDEPNGDFPTVKSPNPEEPEALAMALDLAREKGAELVMGTDPDTDRIGIAVRNFKRQLVLLNGNQTASLLVRYMLSRMQQKGTLPENGFLAKTIVTTGLIKDIAAHYNIPVHITLTGFKYIAEIIRKYEGEGQFIVGGEESYGYLVGDFVRDKDAVSSAAMIAEMAAWLHAQGLSVYGYLIDTWQKFGCYQERLVSLTKEGKAGLEEIAAMMQDLRTDSPQQLGGIPVQEVEDYLEGPESTGLPVSNVLQFFLTDGSKVTARPSGTEPKIKFYISVRTVLDPKDDLQYALDTARKKTDAILHDLIGQ